MQRELRPDLIEPRRHLAAMIDDALRRGQCGDGTPERLWQPWTNDGFATRVTAAEASIRAWRNRDRPSVPYNILPLLRAFYGDLPRYADARDAMLLAWRRSRGLTDEPPPPPRTIEISRFSDFAEIVDLGVSQPTPDSNGDLTVPWTLHIYPDTACEIGGQMVEIGVIALCVIIESRHWQPVPDSVFRRKKHPTLGVPAPPGGVLIVGPVDEQGRIAGTPLEDEPQIIMEPLGEAGDGPITFSVRVKRDGFKITSRGKQDAADTQKAVLDTIFASGIERDRKNRLIIAQATVSSSARRRSGGN